MLAQSLRPISLSLLLITGGIAQAQSTPSAHRAAEELIAGERVRSTIADALERQGAKAATGADQVDNFIEAVHSVVELGADAVPFLVNELEQDLQATFFFASYALGFLDTPESEAALREAVNRAEQTTGEFAVIRKAWSCYALGLQGKADAIDLLPRGTHRVGHYTMHAGMSVLEVAAIQTYPESLSRLLALLESLADDEEARSERIYVLRALSRLADPAAVPKIVALLEEDDSKIRREAAAALSTMPTPEALAGLLRALDDEHPQVRKAAAIALEKIQPAKHLALFTERLATEEYTPIRASLYRLVATLSGSAGLEPLYAEWGKPDPSDRKALIRALGLAPPAAESLVLLRAALSDRSPGVAVHALSELGRHDDAESIQLVSDALRSTSWSIAQTALRILTPKHAPETAKTVAERLLKVELHGSTTDPLQMDRARVLLDALVQLGQHKAIPELKKAAARQTDAALVERIDEVVGLLEIWKRNRRNVERWIATIDDTNPEARALAYRVLGEIGGEDAERALTRTFGRVDVKDGLAILRAVQNMDSARTRKLVERILVSPAFDSVATYELRDTAAWIARRFGGPEMIAALEQSAERRNGRDAKVLVYLALLAREEALPVLSGLRKTRMRYPKWTRGREQELLDRIARRLVAGEAIDEYDVGPEEVEFR